MRLSEKLVQILDAWLVHQKALPILIHQDKFASTLISLIQPHKEITSITSKRLLALNLADTTHFSASDSDSAAAAALATALRHRLER